MLWESFKRENNVLRKLYATEKIKFETKFNNLCRDNPKIYVKYSLKLKYIDILFFMLFCTGVKLGRLN